MKILCTICVKKNSQEVKNKNFKKIFKNKSLFSLTLDQASRIKKFDYIFINSNKNINCNFKKRSKTFFYNRKKNLSGQYISKIDVIKDTILHAEKTVKEKFDLIVDLDVTCPFRSDYQIRKAINLFKNKKNSNLVTVRKAKRNPYFNIIELDRKKRLKISKSSSGFNSRQEAPIAYDLTPSIYIWRRNFLMNRNKKVLINKNTTMMIVDEISSFDIDSVFDFQVARNFFEKNV